MPKILRAIKKSRWYKDSVATYQWLTATALPADPLADFNTQNNSLSVWVVDDDAHNLNKIATAMSPKCDFVSNFDLMLVEEHRLLETGCKFLRAPGDTPYSIANQWHRDLIEISASGLLTLMQTYWDFGTSQRISEKTVGKLLKDALTEGHLDRTKIAPKLLDQLNGL